MPLLLEICLHVRIVEGRRWDLCAERVVNRRLSAASTKKHRTPHPTSSKYALRGGGRVKMWKWLPICVCFWWEEREGRRRALFSWRGGGGVGEVGERGREWRGRERRRRREEWGWGDWGDRVGRDWG